MLVKNFALLFDLAYGSYMGGVLGVVMSLLQMIHLTPDFPDDDDDNDGVTDLPEGVTESAQEDEEEDTLRGVFIVLVVFGFLLLVSSLLLFWATWKRISKFIVPWLVTFFSCSLLIFLIELVPEFIDYDNLSAWYFIFIVFFISVCTYMWLAVYSFYRELTEEEMNNPPV